MKRFIYSILVAVFTVQAALSQGVINEQQQMIFANEQTIGAFLNSNGIGLDYRFGKRLNARNQRIYEASFDYVKHPKEYKTVINTDIYTRRYVFGKENLFWELRGQIGNQHEIFTKHDYSSISIRMFYAGGASIGFQKPIYYEILTFSSTGTITGREIKKFDPGIHQYNYGGNAGFFKGFNELKVIPGITAKAGVSFEYSEKEPVLHAIEAGIALTVYPRNIQIMATEETQFIFVKMFAGYRFGTLLDISERAKAKSRRERRKELKEAIGDPMNIIK
ncbi:hypothetical protein ACFLT1_05670 [Bacteroidota bacterium]